MLPFEIACIQSQDAGGGWVHQHHVAVEVEHKHTISDALQDSLKFSCLGSLAAQHHTQSFRLIGDKLVQFGIVDRRRYLSGGCTNQFQMIGREVVDLWVK